MEVHNELGNGFIPYEREKLLTVVYKGKKLNKEYYADFVCYENIIVELKSVSMLSKPHKAQVLNYLNAANMEIGLLVNFGQTSLKWERITKFLKRNVVDISNPCGNKNEEEK